MHDASLLYDAKHTVPFRQLSVRDMMYSTRI